ncbi:hypothetical protein U8335_04355 [Roseiconus lacunae]|uniref:hypothetical protein n=1 Tax=Roseiconus lacunae TaxID=2605694 RepID=UPI00308CD7C8|nr:hypothetical protein U8335_04355 [Stieleria sp. HD01]
MLFTLYLSTGVGLLELFGPDRKLIAVSRSKFGGFRMFFGEPLVFQVIVKVVSHLQISISRSQANLISDSMNGIARNQSFKGCHA